MSREELIQAVHENLRNLGLEVLDVVNLRSMFDAHGPAEGSLEEPLTVLAELQQQGLIQHIGLSNVTSTQVGQGRTICDIVCVQNQYYLARRDDAGPVRHRSRPEQQRDLLARQDHWDRSERGVQPVVVAASLR